MDESWHSGIINRLMRRALSSGNLTQVKELVANCGLSYSPLWLNGYELLRLAVERNDSEVAKFFLSKGCPVNHSSTDKAAPVYLALRQRNSEIFSKLIEMGADVNTKVSVHTNIFHLSIEMNDFSIGSQSVVEFLIEKGANINSQNDEGETALHIEVKLEYPYYKRRPILAMLLDGGADVNAKCSKGQTPLHVAVEKRNLIAVESLIARNVSIDSQCLNGKTALQMALEDIYPSTQLPRLLLENGASADFKCFKNKCPLHVAVERRLADVIELLIAKNSFIDCQCSDDKTPLHIAIENSDWSSCKILLEKGSSVNTKDKNGVTPLHLMSSRYVDESCISMLLDKTLSVNEQDNEGNTALHIAIKYRNWSLTQKLIRKQAFVDIRAKNGETALHAAAKIAKIENFEFIIKHGVFIGEGLKSKCLMGWSPLDLAVQHNKIDIVYLILENLLNDCQKPLLVAVKNGDMKLLEKVLKDGVNKEDEGNRLVFHTALRSDRPNTKIIEMLTEFGFEVDPRDNNLHIILTNSIKYGYVKVVEDILKFDVGVNELYLSDSGHDAVTPLHLATIHGKNQVAKLLIDYGADINAIDDEDHPVVFYAAVGKDMALLDLLLSHNADISKVPDILTSAVEKGSLELVKKIILKGVNVNLVNSSGQNALHCTVLGQEETIQTEVAEFLLSRGANVNATIIEERYNGSIDEEFFKLMKTPYLSHSRSTDRERKPGGKTTLHAAIEAGLCKLAETLLEHKADVNAINENFESPIHISAQVGNAFITEMLVKRSADVQAVTAGNVTPLHLAVAYDKPLVVKILCEAGADINAKTKFDFTPLNIAVKIRDTDMIKILLDFGADIDCKDRSGNTSLLIAVANGKEKVLTFLLEKGANIECRNKMGDTSLHFAVTAKNAKITDLILDHGALINSKNKSGKTPLHIAAEKGDTAAVDVLLKWNADIDCVCVKRETPIHLAIINNRANIVELLLKKGADLNILCEKGSAMDHTLGKARHYGAYYESAHGYDDYDTFNGEDCYDSYYETLDYSDDQYDSYGDSDEDELEVVRESCFNLIQRHMVLMNAVNMPLDPQLVNFLSPDESAKYMSYEELDLMKITPIGNSTITYFKFLQKNVQELATVLKNEEIFNILQSESYQRQFNHFSLLLSNHFHKGLHRRVLIDKVIANSSLIFPNLPDECVEEIVSYLTREELITFVDCFRKVRKNSLTSS